MIRDLVERPARIAIRFAASTRCSSTIAEKLAPRAISRFCRVRGDSPSRAAHPPIEQLPERKLPAA